MVPRSEVLQQKSLKTSKSMVRWLSMLNKLRPWCPKFPTWTSHSVRSCSIFAQNTSVKSIGTSKGCLKSPLRGILRCVIFKTWSRWRWIRSCSSEHCSQSTKPHFSWIKGTERSRNMTRIQKTAVMQNLMHPSNSPAILRENCKAVLWKTGSRQIYLLGCFRKSKTTEGYQHLTRASSYLR